MIVDIAPWRTSSGQTIRMGLRYRAPEAMRTKNAASPAIRGARRMTSWARFCGPSTLRIVRVVLGGPAYRFDIVGSARAAGQANDHPALAGCPERVDDELEGLPRVEIARVGVGDQHVGGRGHDDAAENGRLLGQHAMRGQHFTRGDRVAGELVHRFRPLALPVKIRLMVGKLARKTRRFTWRGKARFFALRRAKMHRKHKRATTTIPPKTQEKTTFSGSFSTTPDRSRTCDLRFRKTKVWLQAIVVHAVTSCFSAKTTVSIG